MKGIFGFIINTVLSILLGIAAVYMISFLNMAPNSMQVDLPHYMYPDIMPATGTTAYDAEKARERLGVKVHQQLVEAGLIEETTTAPYVPTPEVEAGSRLTPHYYPKYAKPLGQSLVQQGYYTAGQDGEADLYFSPGPDGTWYVYDPAAGRVSEAPGDAAMIPCSYEDLITFKISRDPAGKISSDMAEILAEADPVEDLGEVVKSAVECFGGRRMKGSWFASLLQYQAAGRFLGFEDRERVSNVGIGYYLSGEDRRTINQVVYNTKYAETFTESARLNGDVISAVMDKGFYTYDPDTRKVGKVSFWSEEEAKGLRETEIGILPEGYTVPPVAGWMGKTPCCVFAGNSSVQMMDLASGEIRELEELSPADGETLRDISFVFGTDRLVLFYTTDDSPEDVRVSEILYSSQEG